MNADNASRARMGKLKKKAEGYGIPVHDEMTEEVLREAIRQHEEENGHSTPQQASGGGITSADLLKMGEILGKEIAKGQSSAAAIAKGEEEETMVEVDPADIGDIRIYYAPYLFWILPAKRVAGRLVKAPYKKIVFKLDRGSAVQVGTQWQTKYICAYATDNKKEQAYMETHPMFGRMFFLSHKDAQVTSDQAKFAQAFGKNLQALNTVMPAELFPRGAALGVQMSHDMSLNTLRTLLAEKLASIDMENDRINLRRLSEEQNRLSLIQQVVST